MKRCYKCDTPKPLDQFHKNKERKDGRASTCKECRIKVHREHYLNNKEKYLKSASARRVVLRKWVRGLKGKIGCCECDETHSACLVFHHKDPTKKERGISGIIRNGWSIKRAEEEMAKCDVMCANCHLKFHDDHNFGKNRKYWKDSNDVSIAEN